VAGDLEFGGAGSLTPPGALLVFVFLNGRGLLGRFFAKLWFFHQPLNTTQPTNNQQKTTPKKDARGARDVGLQTQLAKSARADGAPPLTVTASAAAHIEAVRCPPRLGQLRELLASCPAYGLMDEADGDDGDDGDGGSSDGDEDGSGSDGEGGGGRALGVGFTTRQLLELVQVCWVFLLLLFWF
jgi:hypothetical protein